MPKQNIFVIGASAGGVEALQQLVRQLPPEFPGTLFVALHLAPRIKSLLPEILTSAGPLLAAHPKDGEKIESGRIYVAPPDNHLVIEHKHMHLSRGPKEQHHRPCINVMFRSAALAYGERVRAVVLTGELDDGTAGMWEVKRRGGVAVIQNPEEAAFPSMPLSALREVEAEYIVNIAEMGALLTRLASQEREYNGTQMASTNVDPQLTDLRCPDCRGPVWELPRDKGTEFRCRVGHVFSAKSMLSEQFAAQEQALYGAVNSLEEGASLATRLAKTLEGPFSERLREEARERHGQAEAIRGILKERSTFTLD